MKFLHNKRDSVVVTALVGAFAATLVMAIVSIGLSELEKHAYAKDNRKQAIIP